MKARLYMIGFAAFPDRTLFLSQLKANGIDAVIDVRSAPRSAILPQFDADRLPDFLFQEGITYLSFAREFGEQPEDSALYKEGLLDYEAFASSEAFRAGITRLEVGLERGLVPVLMDEDADPASAHRGIILSRALSMLGFEVIHITPAGLKTHGQLESELIELARERILARHAQLSLLPQEDHIPVSSSALLEAGYRLKNEEIGLLRRNAE
jgi:uncharacterized protein (DUF488 family)